MKKYVISTVSLLIAILIVLTFLLYKTSYSALYENKILTQDEEIQNAFKNYEIANCDFSLKNPKHAFVSFQHYIYPEDNSEMKFWRVDFYNLKRPHIFSQNWNIQRTGGTTIKNTTFPELVAMVKEDCGQFQEGHGDYYGDKLAWSYSPYVPEPIKTQEEIEFEQKTEELRQREYDRKVDSGEIILYDSLEEVLRAAGTSEEKIKKIVEEKNEEYLGPSR